MEISLRRLAGYHVNPGDKSALEYSRDAAAPVLRQIEAIFIAVRANLFRPDAPRSQRWFEAKTLEEAVQNASVKPFRHDATKFAFSQFDATMSDLSSFQTRFPDHEPDGVAFDASAGVDDSTTLWDLRQSFFEKSDADHVALDEVSDMSDDSQSDESPEESDSGSDDRDRRALIDGERNAVDLVAPSDLVDKDCFKHRKSGKLHIVNKTLHGCSYFKCGRKCNDNYGMLSSVPAFAAHGCMTCFGWSQKPDSDSSD